MRWLAPAVLTLMTSTLAARDKPKVRAWQEGTVQCVRSYPVLWRAEIVLDVMKVGPDGTRFGYSMTGFGNAFLRQEPGAVIRFALDGSHVWIKDAEGIEHKSWLRGRSVLRDGDKLTCGA